MKPVFLPFLFAAAGTLASFAAAQPEFPPDALRRVVREKTIRGENGEDIIRFRVDAE